MENQLIGKIKIKYLPKRLNNTRERQRESKKKERSKAGEGEKKRNQTTRTTTTQSIQLWLLALLVCRFPTVFHVFPHIISKRRRPSFILWPVHESARRTQSAHIGRQQTHVQTLYSNSGGVSLSLPPSHRLSPEFPTRSLLLKCNLAMPQIFSSLVFQVFRCVCVGVPVVFVRVCMCVW